MQPSFHSGRQLPGWGSDLRKLPSTTRRTALAIATFAGLAISGCSTGVAPVPTPSESATPSAAPSSNVSVTSAPGRLKGALAVALAHLDTYPHLASNPYHLVAFRGRALDESGATAATADSTWEFVFSRYADDAGGQRYDLVTVAVPGAGTTSATQSVSTDAAYSPVENWDAASTANTPDSPDFLAPLKTAGAKASNATLTLSQGEVRVEAGGKTVIYDTAEGTFSPVR